MGCTEKMPEVQGQRSSPECRKISIFPQKPFLLCFIQNLTKLECFILVLSLIWRSQAMYLFLKKLISLCTSNIDVIFTYQTKTEISLQPVIQIRPAVNSSLCQEVLWPSILKADGGFKKYVLILPIENLFIKKFQIFRKIHHLISDFLYVTFYIRYLIVNNYFHFLPKSAGTSPHWSVSHFKIGM